MASDKIDLKALERKAYRSTYQDGIWDIYLGLIFLGFAVGPLARNLGMHDDASMILHLTWVVLAGVFLWAGKRYITVPRLGLLVPGAERKRKIVNTRLLLLGSVVVGLVLFILVATDSEGMSGALIGLVFALNILVVLGLMAYLLSFERLFGYAGLYALSLPVGMWMEKHAGLPEAPYTFFVTAGLTLAVGIVLFVRFMRAYPVRAADHTGEVVNGNV